MAEEKIFSVKIDASAAIKGMADLQKQIECVTSAEQGLKKAMKDGTATDAERQRYEQLRIEHKQLNTAKKDLERQMTNELKLNKAAEGSLEAMRAQAALLKQQIDRLSEAERNNASVGGQLIKQRKELNDKIKEAELAYGDAQRNVGNYEEAIRNALGMNNKYVAGLTSLTGGLKGAGAQFRAFGQALTGLLANPAFLAVAGIVGAGTALKFWYDYNKGVEEAIRLTREFTGELPREQLEAIRQQVIGISETYGKEYKEVMQAADALVANFGVSWEEALRTIRDGFTVGADLNGDFLAKIQQTAGQMGALGISTATFVGYLKQTTTGIFSDQGINLIAKAGVNLRKMTDQTAKDLAAIGIDLDKLRRTIAEGKVEEAIKQVAAGLKAADANSQAYANAMSDVFGAKAQLNAQKMIEAIADMDTSLDSLKATANEYNKLQDELVESQVALAREVNDLFGVQSSLWDVLTTKMQIFWNKLQAAFLHTLNMLGVEPAEFADKAMGKGTQPPKEPKRDRQVQQAPGGYVVVTDKATGKVIKEGRYKNSPTEVTAPTGGGGGRGGGRSGGRSTTVTDRSKEELAELRKAEDLKLKLLGDSAEQQRRAITLSYDRQVEDLRAKLAKEKNLTAKERTAINEQIVSLESIKDNELKELAARQEAEALRFTNDLLAKRLEVAQSGTREEMELRRQQLENQKAADLAALEQSTLSESQKAEMRIAIIQGYVAKVKALQAQWASEEQQREALNYEARVLEATTEQERLAAQLEQAKFLRDSARQQEVESAEAFRVRQLELQAQYVAAQKALADQEVAIQRAKFAAIGGALGAASQLLGQFSSDSKAAAVASKALALGQIAVSQGVAIAEGVKQAQSVPFPANIAAIATTVATILSTIVSAVKTVKSAKFAEGGLVEGAGTGTSDSIAARLSNGESVMTAKTTEMFAPLLSTLNQLGGGVPIQVQQQGTQQLGEEVLARAFARGAASLPSPVVSVVDINDVQGRVRVIEQEATL